MRTKGDWRRKLMWECNDSQVSRLKWKVVRGAQDALPRIFSLLSMQYSLAFA